MFCRVSQNTEIHFSAAMHRTVQKTTLQKTTFLRFQGNGDAHDGTYGATERP